MILADSFSTSGTVWIIVGVLLIVALLMYILGKRPGA